MKLIKPWDFIAWINWVFFISAKIIAKILAPIAVLIIDDKKNHPIWGINDTTDFSWKNMAITNGAHNFAIRDAVNYETRTNTDDETLEGKSGLQWRLRRSESGGYISFRVTWGKPDGDKGKNEVYIGWTMNETKYMRPTLQVRPAWMVLIPVVLFLVWILS